MTDDYEEKKQYLIAQGVPENMIPDRFPSEGESAATYMLPETIDLLLDGIVKSPFHGILTQSFENPEDPNSRLIAYGDGSMQRVRVDVLDNDEIQRLNKMAAVDHLTKFHSN